ncbi:MAG: hypothetical protein KI786_18090 [Mameliella sp.]|nr:hypothetical protein [Phaeodactylibacter sp.]NRA47739.1 hypothetical protein [Phaeodactylibacter sp.]
MRLLPFALILLFMNACSTEASRQEGTITDFSDQWDQTTSLVTKQVTDILKAQEEAQQLLAALDTVKTTEAEGIKSRLQDRLNDLATASEASFAFVNRWQEGAAQINQMKEANANEKSTKGLSGLAALQEEGLIQAQEWAIQVDSTKMLFEEAKLLLQ